MAVPPLLAPPNSLSSTSILGAMPNLSRSPLDVTAPSLLWKDLLSNNKGNSKNFSVSYEAFDSEEVKFSEHDLSEGRKDWEMSLVGYAIGKRPFYGSLLAAVQKKWKLKGSFELLTLEGDFFLFKFSCQEDLDAIWDNGPCFFNGRPFFFKKWSWDFLPVKEELSSIPLWVKFPNLPLCCWTESGLSRIASRIGLPLAVDNLTASKTRLTFARVCVQVSPSSPLPSSLSLDLNGKKISQEVQYDWKPSVCSTCSTFSHNNISCPLNPSKPFPPRGRSRSRQGRPPKASFPTQNLSKTASHTNNTNITTFPPPAQPTRVIQAPLVSTPTPLSDLNLLPVQSPPLVIVEETNLPTNSSESPKSLAGTSLPAIATTSSASPGHSHALRSFDSLPNSPHNEVSEVPDIHSSTSSQVQTKGKKKGKK